MKYIVYITEYVEHRLCVEAEDGTKATKSAIAALNGNDTSAPACPACSGFGAFTGPDEASHECRKCDGSGTTSYRKNPTRFSKCSRIKVEHVTPAEPTWRAKEAS